MSDSDRDKDITKWVTIHGTHIPIRDGQTTEEAIKEHRNKHELNANEKQALLKYTGSYSYIINYKLRNKIELSDSDKAFLQDFKSAVSKLPKYKGIITRDLSLDNTNDVMNFVNGFKGNKITSDSIWSFTKLKSYMDNPKVRIRIMNSEQSIDISKYNGYGEEETIYLPGTKFINPDIRIDDNGMYLIFLEEDNSK